MLPVEHGCRTTNNSPPLLFAASSNWHIK